jgi:hypothetical protein
LTWVKTVFFEIRFTGVLPCEGFPVTIVPDAREKWPRIGALFGRLKAAAGLARRHERRGVERAPFERNARDPELSAAESRLAESEFSPDQARQRGAESAQQQAAMRAYLPIGPSCC